MHLDDQTEALFRESTLSARLGFISKTIMIKQSLQRYCNNIYRVCQRGVNHIKIAIKDISSSDEVHVRVQKCMFLVMMCLRLHS